MLDTQRVNWETCFWEREEITAPVLGRNGRKCDRTTALRALDSVREVYGIQRTQFNEKEHIVRVLFDASRLNEDAVASLLRQAGLDLTDRLTLA